MSGIYTINGEVSATLANAVSDAIHAATEAGMDVDAAATIAASVAVDYAKNAYGVAYIDQMFAIIRGRL